jgi:hypothetical protein
MYGFLLILLAHPVILGAVVAVVIAVVAIIITITRRIDDLIDEGKQREVVLNALYARTMIESAYGGNASQSRIKLRDELTEFFIWRADGYIVRKFVADRFPSHRLTVMSGGDRYFANEALDRMYQVANIYDIFYEDKACDA